MNEMNLVRKHLNDPRFDWDAVEAMLAKDLTGLEGLVMKRVEQTLWDVGSCMAAMKTASRRLSRKAQEAADALAVNEFFFWNVASPAQEMEEQEGKLRQLFQEMREHYLLGEHAGMW